MRGKLRKYQVSKGTVTLRSNHLQKRPDLIQYNNCKEVVQANY